MPLAPLAPLLVQKAASQVEAALLLPATHRQWVVGHLNPNDEDFLEVVQGRLPAPVLSPLPPLAAPLVPQAVSQEATGSLNRNDEDCPALVQGQ